MEIINCESKNNKPKKSKKKKNKFVGTHGDERLPEIWKSVPSQIMRFVKRATPSVFAASASATQTGAFLFTLDSVNGYAEITTLFDEYMIEFVEVIIRPMYNNLPVSSPGTGNSYTQLYTCIDYDDAAVVTLNAIQEYGTCRITRPTQTVKRSLRPKFSIGAYSGAFTSYALKRGFIDCNSPSVQHYAVKYVLPQVLGSQTNLPAYQPEVVYYIVARYSR
jgi:hypothetical protein